MIRKFWNHEMISDRNGTAFLVVDFQERLVPHIQEAGIIEENLVRMAQAARILDVPLFFSEQYPKGLGPTVDSLQVYRTPETTFEKIAFNCFGEPGFRGKLEEFEVRTLIIAGVEAHICVAQTALGALSEGYRVHVLADAVGSRNREHASLALARLAAAGATISFTEMALFELLGKAGTPEFKEIQALVKENRQIEVQS